MACWVVVQGRALYRSSFSAVQPLQGHGHLVKDRDAQWLGLEQLSRKRNPTMQTARINRRLALRVSTDKGTCFTRNKWHWVFILVMEPDKKRPLKDYFPVWRRRLSHTPGPSRSWEGQWLFKQTYFSSFSWVEVADRRHQFPNTLYALYLSLSSFLSNAYAHAKHTPLKLWLV